MLQLKITNLGNLTVKNTLIFFYSLLSKKTPENDNHSHNLNSGYRLMVSLPAICLNLSSNTYARTQNRIVYDDASILSDEMVFVCTTQGVRNRTYKMFCQSRLRLKLHWHRFCIVFLQKMKKNYKGIQLFPILRCLMSRKVKKERF